MARRTKADEWAGTETVDAPGNETTTNNMTDTGAQSTSSGAGIADSAKETVNQAKQAAGRVIDQAKDEAASRVDQQRQSAATGLQSVADAFRSMGNDLRSQQQGPVAQYAAEIGNAMGGQVERAADYLKGRDFHQLVTDAEDLARRSPALFLGSAFVLGLAASRFLKSSRPAASGSGPSYSTGNPQERAATQSSGTPSLPALTGGSFNGGIPLGQGSTESEQLHVPGSPGFGDGLDPTGGI